MNEKSSFTNFNKEKAMNDDVKIYLKTGTILNKQYVIDKPIFQNSKFVNYIAFDKNSREPIVIKEFFPKTLTYRNIFQSNEVVCKTSNEQTFNIVKNSFIKIFDILQNFKNNASVIKILDLFEFNNTFYCIQELPQGLTLKRYLSNNYGELNWHQSKNMFLRLIEFLQHLHNQNIFYCGLNPENIVVYNNTLKIIDFSNSIINSNHFILPPKLHDGYAPIEQYNNSNLGTFTDVYSIAAVIYKSLTGTKPINSTSRLLNDNLLPPKNLNNNVPKNISVSIMSALILSAKLRTQTMNDFFDDLMAHSREFYQNISINSSKIHTHVNTIEPIKKKAKHKNEKKEENSNLENEDGEMATHSLIFMAMLISSSVVLFTAAIVIFILFRNNFFNL